MAHLGLVEVEPDGPSCTE